LIFLFIAANNYLPKGRSLLAVLGSAVMALMAMVMVPAVRRWRDLLREKPGPVDEHGDRVRAMVPE
jgi:hypothetical protein